MLGRLRRHRADAPQSAEAIDRQIERQAAYWYERATSPDLTTDEGGAFRFWYGSSGAHRTAYDRLVYAMDRIGFHGAAISVAGTKKRRVTAIWREASALVAAAALIMIAGVGYLSLKPSSPEPASYIAGVGERRIVKLEDGSTMTLNTASEARVSMSNDVRRIDFVRGQGLFDVASDPDRPFQVHTASGVIIAIGTAFEVRRHADGVSDFTLIEGSAVVSGKDPAKRKRDWIAPMAGAADDADGAIILEPGQKVSTDSHGALTGVRQIDLAQSTSWTEGRVVLKAAALRDALAEINRYARPRERLLLDDDPALDRLQISGVFSADNIPAFARNLELLLPVAAVEDEDTGKVVIRYRPENG